MEKARRAILAVVLVICGFALMASAGYLARADAGGVMFGGGSDMGGNAPRKSAPPRGNSPMGNAPEDWDDEEEDEREPIPEGESIWEDIPEDELTNKARLEHRPGNYGVLEALFSFLEGAHQIEPELKPLVFPLRSDEHHVEKKDGEVIKSTVRTKVYEKREEFEEEWEELVEHARKRGKKKQNDGRAQNVFVEEIQVRDFPIGDSSFDDAEEFGLDERQRKVFVELRDDHSGQCAVIKLTMRVESLKSDAVDTSTRFFALVRADDAWKICWISRMIE